MSGLALELRDVGLWYGSRPALSGISAEIGAGERICLVGPNGAGKSSLLRCLTGRAEGRVGAVLIDGVPIEELSRERFARQVAVVPSEAVLPFAMRVEEVVALGRIPYEHPLRGAREHDRRAVGAAMARVGIAGLRGRDVRELSLGERQLVLLAMAVAQGGGLLILDEPTVHLDLRHQIGVMELLRELNERDGVTILAVLHDLALAGHFFPRAMLLDQGRLVADGPAETVLAPERISDVYAVDPRFVPRFVATESR
jgi:iron complex transport system ATP-binding protein